MYMAEGLPEAEWAMIFSVGSNDDRLFSRDEAGDFYDVCIECGSTFIWIKNGCVIAAAQTI